jgi:integrase
LQPWAADKQRIIRNLGRKEMVEARGDLDRLARSAARLSQRSMILSLIGSRSKARCYPVNLHRFRRAAATLWSVQDPANVRGVKDLLGHASFGTTEKHYIMAQTRLAGRVLAHAVERLKGRRTSALPGTRPGAGLD